MSQSNEITLSQSVSSEPSADWDLERLTKFVREAGVQAGALEAESLKLRTTILRLHYERGKALVVIRDEVFRGKRRAWGRFRREQGFVGTTFDDDMRLYELAYSWEEIEEMGLTEARIYLGVTKPKLRKPKETDTTPDQGPISPGAQGVALASESPMVERSEPPMVERSEPPMVEGAEPQMVERSEPQMVERSEPPANSSTATEETLLLIARRLAELEWEVQGQVAKAALPHIDQAVEILGRLRASATRRTAVA